VAAAVNAEGRAGALLASARRELRFLRRNPADLLLVTVFPLAMLAALAWLLSAAVIRELPIAYVDQDGGSLGRALARKLDASPGLRVAAQPRDLAEAWSLVRSLQVYAVVYLPPNAARDLQRQGSGTVFSYYNASYLPAGQGASRDIAAAIGALNLDVLQEQVALRSGPASLRPPPVTVQSAILFNSARSFEYFLLGLLFPAVLHLVACLAMAGALGREIRDGSHAGWLAASPAPVFAVVGKLLPYFVLFVGYGALGTGYLIALHGGVGAAQLAMLLLAQLALYAACAAITLLLVGLTRDMGKALSFVGLYVGTAMAFSGATFPVVDAPLFTRVWNTLLPLTAYVKLQAQQLTMGAPATASLPALGTLLLFVLVPALIGLRTYLAAADAAGRAP